jgi:hypothetical protein
LAKVGSGGSADFKATVTIKWGTGGSSSFACTQSATVGLSTTTATNYYFTIHPGTALAKNTNFQITVAIQNVGNKDLQISAYAIDKNALSPASGVLPVHFSSFDAKKSGSAVNLVWKTDAEDNVSGFDVERSADGKYFSKIGFVAAANQGTYTFTDAKALTGANYYRIKSVDLDGKFMYSTVVALKGDNSLTVLKAFPMPVSSELTIQHDAATSSSKITISSEDGRLVKAINPTVGNIQTSLNVSSLKAGLYLVRFDNGNGNAETIKVVKQ